MATGTYRVESQTTTAITGTTGAALSREAAVAAHIAAATGPTGTEVHVYQSDQIAASGPTGTYAITSNRTFPATGSTYSAESREDAANKAVTAAAAATGGTGPGAGIDIRTITP